MKKLLSIICITLIMTMAFTGCSNKKNSNTEQNEENIQPQEKTKIKVASLKGPTSLGLLQMMDDKNKDSFVNDYDFKIYDVADEIVIDVVKGEVDLALVPANLAANLYQKTNQGIKVIDINTLGVLYAIEHSDQIQSMTDLKGKTICMTGKGSVPEYALSYILGKNGLSMDDLTVEFKSEPAEVIAYLSENKDAIGILPQPFVTTALMQDDSLRVALDLNSEWTKVDTKSTYVTGVTIVRNDFLEHNKEAVDSFITEHAKSVEYVNDNVDEAATIAETLGIVKAPVAQKAIPQCNIVSITKDEMKTKLSGYLQTLFDSNAASVGGSLPDEGFYYIDYSQK